MSGVPSAPALPERIGRYRVVQRIGRGAMGVVYAAEDDHLGRRVAIKLMLGAFDEDPELRERFFREARITGQLAHRNIVTVFDLGEEGSRPFIVMELLEGQPLGDFLRSGAGPSLDMRLDLMAQVCAGLQSAHAAGVVHRDIKPNNLHVLRDGTLKLLDFGVARLASSNLTANGMLLGTPEYMSPEQARGQKMDARSDVFSASGVFYYIWAAATACSSTATAPPNGCSSPGTSSRSARSGHVTSSMTRRSASPPKRWTMIGRPCCVSRRSPSPRLWRQR